MSWNLDTPEGRFAAAEALGPEGYNRAMLEKFERDTVQVVNGHPIRRVASRFGQLFMVDGTGLAFYTLAEAITHAEHN
ncbi:hypothetical protein AB3X94_37395 [Paraburkholderia sp. BR10923]|uniref:hypothetical protein n=1 Tax=Paraburkholderia sp. BR10923 TaxID=3236992 RepID=UPI0034CE118A